MPSRRTFALAALLTSLSLSVATNDTSPSYDSWEYPYEDHVALEVELGPKEQVLGVAYMELPEGYGGTAKLNITLTRQDELSNSSAAMDYWLWSNASTGASFDSERFSAGEDQVEFITGASLAPASLVSDQDGIHSRTLRMENPNDYPVTVYWYATLGSSSKVHNIWFGDVKVIPWAGPYY
jgi:hypothetical protein